MRPDTLTSKLYYSRIRSDHGPKRSDSMSSLLFAKIIESIDRKAEVIESRSIWIEKRFWTH